MTAKGKINASKVQAGDRIIIDTAMRVYGGDECGPSRTKTGETVQVGRVLDKLKPTNARGYIIVTNLGRFYAEPIQTMWLAPEDNAGIKRAYAEAVAEDAERAAQVAQEAPEAPAEDETTPAALVAQMDEAHEAVTTTETAPATTPVSYTGSTVVKTIEKVWDRIRADHPELPEVVVTTGSGEGVKWGHFRPESWKRAEDGTKLHEFFLASEALAKGAHQVLQTTIHEAAHTLNRVRGVQDTSRQGRWHNAQFRKTAEELGLEHPASQADKSHGFSFVKLTEATKVKYADLLAELDEELKLTGLLPWFLGGADEEDERGGEKIAKPKKGEGEDGETKTQSGNLKATCGCAEPNIIRASRKILDLGVVRCDECEELFTAA